MRKSTHECEAQDEFGEVQDSFCAACATPGDGYTRMLSTMRGAGLEVPRLPTQLRVPLRQAEPWLWTTTPIDETTRLDDYMMRSAETIGGAVADSLAVSHGGHGINSYAVTWRMTWGPLAMIVQNGWGGIYSDSRSEVELAELFARVAPLVDLADGRAEECNAHEGEMWVRPIRLVVSPMRRIFECDIWSARSGSRIPIELDGDPWSAIEHALRTATIPDS